MRCELANRTFFMVHAQHPYICIVSIMKTKCLFLFRHANNFIRFTCPRPFWQRTEAIHIQNMCQSTVASEIASSEHRLILVNRIRYISIWTCSSSASPQNRNELIATHLLMDFLIEFSSVPPCSAD